jgi:hypothetical protein
MTDVATGSQEASPDRRLNGSPSTLADILYETFYGGAIGGSILALFFVAVDALQGQALFTPSVLGTAFFTDAAASTDAEIRLDMVAYFSVLHLAAFLLIGLGLAVAYRRLGAYSRRPTLMAALTFAVLTGGFATAGVLFAPGVVGVIGLPWIAAGNLLTAIGMVAFMEWAHREGGGSSYT